jgi:Smg protein
VKESILDVLMYLFEYYMDDDTPVQEDQTLLKDELIGAGFPLTEVERALAWLESLAEEKSQLSLPAQATAMRLYAAPEIAKLDVECRGFLLFLEQMGALDAHHRELALDRCMALEAEEISLEQLKWVVLMVLFNQPGQEESLAWMEDLAYAESNGLLH